MIILGINAQNHDASVTVFDYMSNKILFAGHAERYSRVKNDRDLNDSLLLDALECCNGEVGEVIWHENPLLKKVRYVKAGQWKKFFSDKSPARYLKRFGLADKTIITSSHHKSHAAGGFYTSPFDEAAVVVIDAIGELDATTVFIGYGENLDPIYQEEYPHSIGLFYSAFTKLVGLKPNEEEYIFMGMAAYGDPGRFKDQILREYIRSTGEPHEFNLVHNLHLGVTNWEQDLNERDTFDIAAAVQEITEEHLVTLLRWVQRTTQQKNLVLSGGVALNCVANRKIAQEAGFENIWVSPNPGDAGNSLGAILNITRQHIESYSPYLGHNIGRLFNTSSCLMNLIGGWIVGIANGRAEFGPRALGNRSLLADPRGADIKDRLNKIKHRQKFRPFAPIILEELAADYFEMPVQSSPFMQFTAKVKRPDLYPAITHQDGTARVQTLSKEMNPQLYELIKLFYNATNCPMLVNTSLNIKGEPMVNTWEDACRFREKHNTKVY